MVKIPFPILKPFCLFVTITLDLLNTITHKKENENEYL